MRIVEYSLKTTLVSLVQSLFGRCQYRWVDATFPFTHPSWELEILYQDEWLEVLGCGILQQGILNNSAVPSKVSSSPLISLSYNKVHLSARVPLPNLIPLTLDWLGIWSGTGATCYGHVQYPRYSAVLERR